MQNHVLGRRPSHGGTRALVAVPGGAERAGRDDAQAAVGERAVELAGRDGPRSRTGTAARRGGMPRRGVLGGAEEQPAQRRDPGATNDAALALLVRENAEVTEQVKLGFEQALRTLVRCWDDRLRTIERERDQLLDLIDKLLVYGVEPETLQRADELAAVIHARIEDQGTPVAERPAPAQVQRPSRHLARLKALLHDGPDAEGAPARA